MRSLRDAQREAWDIVIVGTGMGGATLGLTLARAGKRVLFIEKGRNLQTPDALRAIPAEADPAFRGENAAGRRALLARAGRVTTEVHDVALDRPVLPEMGCGTGGSSALYGMVMERFFPSDFEPRASHQDAADSTIPERWPVTYEELRPWYEQAERLYGVRGGADPLRPEAAALLPPPVDLSPNGRALIDHLASGGLHPYRLHLACESRPNCASCQGYLCPNDCKNDADRVALRPALQAGAVLLDECEAVSLEAGRTRVSGVVCDKAGERATVCGRIVVVAAGALGSPALLLSSRSRDWPNGVANGSSMVGRNLMRHGIDLWALLRAPRLSGPLDAKATGFNDLYQGTAGKLGTVQSFGLPPPLEYLRNQQAPVWRLASPLARILWRRFSSVPIMAGILEDLPYAANRVEVPTAGTNGRLRLHYRPGPSEIRRRRVFRAQLRLRFHGLGAVLLSAADAPKALGHACGTCRFGDDPATSVLNRETRAHDLDNLYVVDASVYPSSAGINPALTVAANALRVAAHLHSRL